jgi:hypothetical protein
MGAGSKTCDGVRFVAYPKDHPPPHVHGSYAETEVILELDVDHYLPCLLQHQYGSQEWMAALQQRGVAA